MRLKFAALKLTQPRETFHLSICHRAPSWNEVLMDSYRGSLASSESVWWIATLREHERPHSGLTVILSSSCNLTCYSKKQNLLSEKKKRYFQTVRHHLQMLQCSNIITKQLGLCCSTVLKEEKSEPVRSPDVSQFTRLSAVLIV